MPAPERQMGDEQSTLLGMGARLWWMFLGDVLLAFCAIFIFRNGGVFFQTADWVFWIVLATLVLIRYVDIRFLGGCTGTGEPASMTHWIRYSIILTLCATAVWVLAHLTGPLFAAGSLPS